MKTVLILLASFFLVPPSFAQAVAVTGGTVEGRVSEGSNDITFEGIPYAAPPVGDNRWRAPQPVVPWQGNRSAAAPVPACLQNDYKWNEPDFLFGSEDCLTLDIRTPGKMGDKLPVMVWIHGGSNRAGSGSGTVRSRITDHGVILVAVQYRLGIFGFLSHRRLAEEQGGSSGNYGLMDQIAALQWVHNNIETFGGDRNNVTIFGESAGSQDVSLLLASPAARGLFHKAIMQSGTPGFGMPNRPLADAFKIGDQLDDLTDSRDNLPKLRRTSAHALLAADLALKETALWNPDLMWVRATLDGKVISGSPKDLLNIAPSVPVIIGSNRFEFGPPPGGLEIAKYLKHWLGENAGPALNFYNAEEKNGADPRLGHIEGRIETDIVFRCPANNLAELLSSKGWPVWRYEFDIGADDGSEAGALTSHAYEIGFIMNRKPLGSGKRTVEMQDYWVNFAKYGNPNGLKAVHWKRQSIGQKPYALFDRHGFTAKHDLRLQPCNLTNAI